MREELRKVAAEMLGYGMTMKQALDMMKDAMVEKALELYHPTYKAALAMRCDYRTVIEHHPHQFIRTREERREAVNQ